MKKFFAITIAIVMIMAMTTTAFAAEDTTTVYFDIGDTDFGTVYCYAWESGNMNNKNGAWPGVEMTHVTGSIYSIELSSSWDTVIFNNGGTQTQDITLPTDGKNLYLYDSETWSTYSAATNKYDDKGAGDYTIGVSGAYTPGANAADVVSVDVAWDPMNFTYSEGTLGTWSPENHSYSGGTEGGWSTDKAGITVTNHSNVGVDAAFSFTANSGVNVTGTFYNKGENNTYTAVTSAAQQISLTSAVGTEVTAAPTGTLYFGVSGDAISENKTLGTITVTIAKDTWTEVTSETDLKNALQAGGKVKLGADIELENQLSIYTQSNSDLTIVLDLNGYTITDKATISGLLFFGNERDCNLKVTIKDTSVNQTGKITGISTDVFAVACTNVHTGSAEITVEGGIISGSVALNVLGNAKAVINAGTLCSNDTSNYALWLGGPNSSVVMNGGIIKNTVGDRAIYTCASTQTLKITDGKITGKIYVDSDSPAGITITGGTYSFDPTAYVDTNSYTVTKTADSTWTVAAKTSD